MQTRFLVLIACAIAIAVPAWAHHSHNNYVPQEFTLLEGTVTEVHWLAPHSWVYLDVKDATGKATMWALEATSATGLKNNGIKREDVKPGDTIKVRCHRLRDGGNGCLLGFLTPTHGGPSRGQGIEKEWD